MTKMTRDSWVEFARQVRQFGKHTANFLDQNEREFTETLNCWRASLIWWRKSNG